ncbi:MAG: sulfatase-like hydrolase/transferase [Edaphobacter sp.]|uniref:sulfatase-like hydrolase/transferase n=1 Tax=Edaphobacter sp. TaxID=1934404 RepID=UPI0023871E13|nr:sulfatase-like hydrolase/transferase [Edaphobacter sp.]MDE1175699.1 sulfatase-like hydrolase/transferase [Edaphobacter sp.]
MNRRHFLSTMAAATLAAGGSPEASAQQPAAQGNAAAKGSRAANAPNILIFMPDQQNGATVLPESPVIKPHLDRFRRDAVTFDSAHCPAPHCCPSRASFMSGRYPSEHGVYNNVSTNTAIHFNPYEGTPFWGKDLRQAGYQLGYAGKLHVGRDITPESCGFENLSSLEQDTVSSKANDRSRQLQKAHEDLANGDERSPGEIIRPGWSNLQLYKTLPNHGPTGYDDLNDTKIVRAAIDGMHRMAAASEPWCIMVSNSGAHDPYNVPQRFVDLYDIDKTVLPESYRDNLEDKPRVYQRQRYQYWSQLSDNESKEALRHYYAKCSMQDALFGELLDALEATGQGENTIVIYTSDHGDYAAAHGLWMKGVPSFREAYHVPAIIRWPRYTNGKARRLDGFVEHVDYASTLLEAAGVASSAPISGKSLLPWIKGEAPKQWREMTHFQLNGVELYYTQRIVMSKDWKYVYNGFDFDELYSLRDDPHELTNLASPGPMNGAPHRSKSPWPQLPEREEEARRELLRQMWSFAAAHNDTIFNPYGTVALAPYGPAI